MPRNKANALEMLKHELLYKESKKIISNLNTFFTWINSKYSLNNFVEGLIESIIAFNLFWIDCSGSRLRFILARYRRALIHYSKISSLLNTR